MHIIHFCSFSTIPCHSKSKTSFLFNLPFPVIHANLWKTTNSSIKYDPSLIPKNIVGLCYQVWLKNNEQVFKYNQNCGALNEPYLPFLYDFAYLLGSISSAILICKVAGLPDPRKTVLITLVRPMYCVLEDVGRHSRY